MFNERNRMKRCLSLLYFMQTMHVIEKAFRNKLWYKVLLIFLQKGPYHLVVALCTILEVARESIYHQSQQMALQSHQPEKELYLTIKPEKKIIRKLVIRLRVNLRSKPSYDAATYSWA